VTSHFLGERMIRFALIFSLLTLAVPSPAAAGNPYGYVDRSGPYIGFAAALAGMVRLDDEIKDETGVNTDTNLSPGLQARAGYRFHPLLGVEADFEWLAKFKVEGPVKIGDIKVWSLTADAKLFLPHWRNGQVFLLAGAGVLGADFNDSLGLGTSADATGFAARFGAGVDVYITKNITVTVGASYVLPTGSVKYLDYVSGTAGLQYRF